MSGGVRSGGGEGRGGQFAEPEWLGDRPAMRTGGGQALGGPVGGPVAEPCAELGDGGAADPGLTRTEPRPGPQLRDAGRRLRLTAERRAHRAVVGLLAAAHERVGRALSATSDSTSGRSRSSKPTRRREEPISTLPACVDSTTAEVCNSSSLLPTAPT